MYNFRKRTINKFCDSSSSEDENSYTNDNDWYREQSSRERKKITKLQTQQAESNSNLSTHEQLLRRFHQEIDNLTMTICHNCKEVIKCNRLARVNTCNRCLKTKQPKQSLDDFDPGSIPNELPTLSFVEEQLIALVSINQYIYFRPGGNYATKGHCINFQQDISEFAKILPRLPEELPIIIVQKEVPQQESIDLKVRREAVLAWLNWLKQHSPLPAYKQLEISQERIAQLPEDGFVQLNSIVCNSEISEENINQLQASSTDLNPESENGVSLPPNSICSTREVIEKFLTSIKVDNQPKVNYPKINTSPISEFNTPYLASAAFPTLFPLCKADPFDISINCEVTFLTRIRHLLSYGEIRRDNNNKQIITCRFAEHPRFVLWIYNIYYRHRVLKLGEVYLRSKPMETQLTRAQIIQMIQSNRIDELSRTMNTYMTSITGSNSYWNNAFKQLKCIIESKGYPHFFYTLSFADRYDPALRSFLNLTEDAPLTEVINSIRRSSQHVNWFFYNKHKEFQQVWIQQILKASRQHGGWYWHRFEWQHRGTIHVHGMFRVGDNAPDPYNLAKQAIAGYKAQKILPIDIEKVKLGLLAEEQLIAFHDSIIVCDSTIKYEDYVPPLSRNAGNKLPMAIPYMRVTNAEEDQLDLTICLQRHVCKVGACLKNGLCRFRFPKQLSSHTKIQYNEVQSKHQLEPEVNIEVVPKRVNDQFIVNHSLAQLVNWRANCELSLLFDYKKVLSYIAKYATKAETKSSVFASAFQSVFSDATNDSTDNKLKLKKVLTKVLAQRDISVMECLHHLNGLPLHESNITVITVSLEPSNKLSNDANGSLEITLSHVEIYKTRLQTHNHLPNIELLNFKSFCEQFNIVNNKITARNNSKDVAIRLIQQYSRNPANSSYWLHCKYQTLFYKPWSINHSDALGVNSDDSDGWIATWHEFKQTEYAKNHLPQSILNNVTYVTLSENEESLNTVSDNTLQNENTQLDWMKLQAISTINKVDINTLAHNYDWSLDRANYSTNELEELSSWLRNKKKLQEESNHINYNIRNPEFDTSLLNERQRFAFNIIIRNFSKRQLLFRLEGVAGTGKSYVIDAIRDQLSNQCIVSAANGVSANNINGTTLHSILLLPISQSIKPLDGLKLRTLEDRFKGVKLLIIDEFSTIGLRFLLKIDQRLRQATGNLSKIFGGLSILLSGDMAQLPPVMDLPLWNQSNISIELSPARELFSEFTLVVELTEQMRQSNPEQVQFRQSLTNLRNGNFNQDDYNLLKTRMHTFTDYAQEFKTAIRLFPTNDLVEEENDKHLRSISEDNPCCTINAIETGVDIARINSDKLKGLKSSITLCKNAKVMLTANLWVAQGLVNGARGIVRNVIYQINSGPPNLPIAVIVEFNENYHGPHLNNKPRYVPITPIHATFESQEHLYERRQIPLRLAHAITIHKSQGLTIDKAVIDLGSIERPFGLSYVALSRVKELQDLYLTPVSKERLSKIIPPTDLLKYYQDRILLIEQTNNNFS